MDINDITYAINGAVFEVNRILGSGFLEKVYENALLVELKRRGLKAESQVPIRVLYKESVVGEYIADILVESKVIVELKTVETIDKIHEGWFSVCPKGTTYNASASGGICLCVSAVETFL